jgi:hypothetical protein
MLKRAILFSAFALSGCGQPERASGAANATTETAEAAFPFDNGTGFLNGYLLQVPKEGDFL